MALYENLLVFAAILLSLTALRLVRRRDPSQWLYMLLVIVELILAGAAIVRDDRFLGAIAVCLCGLTVGLPWLLERAARQVFTLGSPRWAVRMTGLRALLMPGAGLGRQQQILAGFGKVPQKTVNVKISNGARPADADSVKAALAEAQRAVQAQPELRAAA